MKVFTTVGCVFEYQNFVIEVVLFVRNLSNFIERACFGLDGIILVFQARDAVEMRAQLEKKMAQKDKERKEENLRKMAQQAREERAGIKTGVIRYLCNIYCLPCIEITLTTACTCC